MSAQFSRMKMSGNVSLSLMPSTTAPVRRAGSTLTWLVSQPSRAIVSTRKCPFASSPMRETRPVFKPSRAQPNAVLADEPPRYLAKLVTSSSRAPICCA